MRLLYNNGELVGYHNPNCVPVIVEGTGIDYLRELARNWNPEEGRDYLMVDTVEDLVYKIHALGWQIINNNLCSGG